VKELPPYQVGLTAFTQHPLFKHLETGVWFKELSSTRYLAFKPESHCFYLNTNKRLSAPEWSYVIAYGHCCLYFGYYCHPYAKLKPVEWWTSVSYFVHKFLRSMKLFKVPSEFEGLPALPFNTPEKLYSELCRSKELLTELTTLHVCDPSFYPGLSSGISYSTRLSWEDAFAKKVRAYMLESLDSTPKNEKTGVYSGAREAILNTFPMLGALAASYKIECSPAIIQALDIRIAAISAEKETIYFNPGVYLSPEQCLFVMAHELLHVALGHSQRLGSRDPYIWNLACDFVINQWLVDMRVGQFVPGLMLDPVFKGMCAEDIYLELVKNTRLLRKLSSLRNDRQGDLLDDTAWVTSSDGCTKDRICREILSRSFDIHIAQYGIGSMPGGLIEEIKARTQPPIPWNVQLAAWFDEHFTSEEKTRTYSRLSRRQSSTPDIPTDIPKAAWVKRTPDENSTQTFVVVLDTSLSMASTTLSDALGAISSYASSKDVAEVRIVYCDVMPYDGGYISVDALSRSVEVHGRGGTSLQPAIDLISTFKDLPQDAPILIITDGFIPSDPLRTKREHAYLLPPGHRLPYRTSYPIFYLS
jgi:predicted metal-dependent peptidase